MLFRRGQRVRVPDPTGASRVDRSTIHRAGAHGRRNCVRRVLRPRLGRVSERTKRRLDWADTRWRRSKPYSTTARGRHRLSDHFPPVSGGDARAALRQDNRVLSRRGRRSGARSSRSGTGGVKPDGQFVLGYPRRKPHLEVPHGAYGAIRAPRVSEGRHVVRVRLTVVAEWSLYWLDSKEAAEAKFYEIVDIEKRGGSTGRLRARHEKKEPRPVGPELLWGDVVRRTRRLRARPERARASRRSHPASTGCTSLWPRGSGGG